MNGLRSFGFRVRGLAWLGLLIVAACDQQPVQGISDVSIDAPATLVSSQTTNLSATVQGTGTFNEGVSWSVQGGGSFSDPDANPVEYTAPEVSEATVVTVTAAAIDDPSQSAAVEITVRPAGQLEVMVNPDLVPAQPTVPDAQGNPLTVACSRDAQGVQTDFLEGQVLVRPASPAELDGFLERYDGIVLSDDTIPEPPASLGITLTAEQRRATEYLVRINLARVDESDFAEDAAVVDLGGRLEFSSEAGLQTLAAVADAVAAGFDASTNDLSYPEQAFPTPMFGTQERSIAPGGSFTDAFNTTRFQSTGSQSNVTLAWQFVAAHGMQRRVQVAIIDSGFWLNTDGTPRGTDTDFPADPIQYDCLGRDFVADGPNTVGCGPGNPCFWHGTGATGVATGIINNRSGDAGTGGLIADPILIKFGGTDSQRDLALRTAIAWGADVVSMSFGKDCNQACRSFDRDHPVFDNAVNGGSRTVFVAAAGNGRCPPRSSCPPASTVGYDVGEPNFFHPCIEDHVICVGALNDGATSGQGYSNFGGSVDIFAPTNIPVMSQPAGNDNNPGGPAGPVTFGGTSASAPFVAGVAAMMKAINTDLNSDQVATILRDTAHVGSGDVPRYIDAYAAVRRAAQGLVGLKDRFDSPGPAGNDFTPTQLTGAAPFRQANLSLHSGQDRDLFRFDVPGRSTMTIDLAYPEGLGALDFPTFPETSGCGATVLVSDTGLSGRGHRFMYTVAGGPYVVGLGAGSINAYNLAISFASTPVPADGYEPNNQPSMARRLFSLRSPDDAFGFGRTEPRVTLDASIHVNGDVDFYIVRGAHLMPGESTLDGYYPVLKVYGNESPLTLVVYELNPDNTPGRPVGTLDSSSCTPEPLRIALSQDVYYLIGISGSPGRYTLRNGVDRGRSHIPLLVRDVIYEILHPGEPIEHVIRFPEIYVFPNDISFEEIRLTGAGLHMQLLNYDGDVIGEGLPGGDGYDEGVTLDTATDNGVYMLRITPADGIAESMLKLEWYAAPPARVSGNLILNAGAEEGPGDDATGAVDEILNWSVPGDDLSLPTVLYYNGTGGIPLPEDPGPMDRGFRFFAGGPDNSASAIAQTITIDPEWYAAIDTERAKFTASAFLGGKLEEADDARLTLTFLDAGFETLGEAILPSITPLERDGRTGLWPVGGSDFVPARTVYIIVGLEFRRVEGEFNDGYADNLTLTLSDYTP